jgi:hypothetical protein
MIGKIHHALKWFFSQPHFNLWLTHHFLYFAILGIVVFIIIWIANVFKEDKRLNKKRREIEKSLLKSLGRKNKTN